MNAFILLGLLLGGTATGAPDAELLSQSLVGLWSATVVHAGQQETMRLEIAPGDGDSALVARLSLPAIDLRDLALGPITFEDDLVRAGPFEMTWDAAAQTLRGLLPSALVPVFSIPFELRRSTGERAEPVWTQNVRAAVWAGLAVADEMVLVGTDHGAVVALSVADGTQHWRFEAGGRIRARPTIADDVALVHSDDGFLYALSLADGTARWRAKIGPASTRKPLGEPGSRYEHFASSPTVVGGRIYVANAAGELLCLDRQGGEIIWRFEAGDSITSTPAVAGGQVFVGSFDHHVYAVDQATGALIWSRDTGAAVPASPVVIAELVLIGGRSYELLALHAETGKIAWSHYFWFSWVEATAALHDDLAYVGLSDGQLVTAFETGTGKEIWRFDTGGSVWAEPAATDSTIFVGAVGVPGYMVDHRGGFFAVERATGREVWRFPIDAPEGDGAAYGFAAAPTVGHGRVFAATLDGEVFAFEDLRRLTDSLPDLLALRQELEAARPRFDTECERFEEIRYQGAAAEPYREQTQVNCHGALVFGSRRKVELMFNEGILEFIWVLVNSDELKALEIELTEAFGPVVYENATYRVFESGTVALRNDPPEVLVATPRLMEELTGYQGGE